MNKDNDKRPIETRPPELGEGSGWGPPERVVIQKDEQMSGLSEIGVELKKTEFQKKGQRIEN